MATGHLSHDEFFARLTALFDEKKPKDYGSIYLVQKRLTYGADLPAATPENPTPDLALAAPLPIIIRATNGKGKSERGSKIKLSTIVEPTNLEKFYARYIEVCKNGMMALKPRDRSKKKAKAKKKKTIVPNAA